MGKMFKGKKPPPVIKNLSGEESLATKYKPINFVSIMDDLMGDKLDVVRGVDGKISINFTNKNGKSTRMSPDRNIDPRATSVIVLSESMTRLGNAIEELERTSPYLIPENQELITSYRTSINNALERGFDFKQQSVDSKLAKMGLSNSSTALGVQLAFIREKTNAMAEAELKQAELAQGLKQQAIGNLVTRGKLMQDQANTEMDRFKSENEIKLQLRSQDIQKEIAEATLEQDRQKFLIGAGIDALNTGNQQTINANMTDVNRLGMLNTAETNRFAQTSSRGKEILGAILGAGVGYMTGKNTNQTEQKAK